MSEKEKADILEKIDNLKNVFELKLGGFEKDARESLSRLEVQTTLTNGRVSKLEKWQSYVIGFCACLTIVFLPILLMLINDYISKP